MRGFPRVKVVCKGCGKEEEVIYKRRNRKYCNRDCYTKFRNKIWEENKDEIIHLWKEGKGMHTLEKEFGIGHDFIWEKMKSLHIPPNPNSRSLMKRMVNLNPSEDLYYVLGCIYGDASAYKYAYPEGHSPNSFFHRVEMTCKDRDFIEAFQKSLQSLNMRASINSKPSETTDQGFLWKVCVDSKPLYDLWQSITDEKVLKLPKKFKIPLLRGIFDSDGCFCSFSEAKITSCDKDRILFLQQIINSLGFHTEIRETKNDYVKTGKHYDVLVRGEEVKKFLNLINPNIQRKKWLEN